MSSQSKSRCATSHLTGPLYFLCWVHGTSDVAGCSGISWGLKSDTPRSLKVAGYIQGGRTLLGVPVAAKPQRKVVQLDAAVLGASSHWSKRRTRGPGDGAGDNEVCLVWEV